MDCRNLLPNVSALAGSSFSMFQNQAPMNGLSASSFLLSLLLFFLTGDPPNVQCQYVEVQTDLGRIRGLQIRSNLDRPAMAFMGIPFALPPIGNRRFRKPVPHPKWSPKTLMATGYQSCCPQLDINGRPAGHEDCLYLNVFVPAGPEERHQQRRFPVMVYFQGESFENGDAAIYGPENLLDWDVVLVTFNYRLGALGFLSTGDETAPGNWGLYDQRLVLQWIRDHIDRFQGDPTQVTLFGQGAGASSAILQLISPYGNTDRLFNRVIAQSGSPLCPWSFEYHPTAASSELGHRVGCPRYLSPPELIRCLQKVPSDRLLRAQQQGKIFGEYPHQFVPVIEPITAKSHAGVLIPESPRTLIVRGNYRPVPLMMGYNQDETAFLYPLILSRKLYGDSPNLRHYLEQKLLPRFIRATILERIDQTNNIEEATDKRRSAKIIQDIQQQILFNYFNYLNSKNFSDMAARFVNMSTEALYSSCIDETLRLYSSVNHHHHHRDDYVGESDDNRNIISHHSRQKDLLLTLPFANVTYKYMFGYRGRNSMLNMMMPTTTTMSLPPPHQPSSSSLIFPQQQQLSSSSSSSLLLSTPPPTSTTAVCHGDELFYLFKMKLGSASANGNDTGRVEDSSIQRRLLQLWTDFAKHGFAPLIASTDLPYWPPYNPSGARYTYQIKSQINSVPGTERDWATDFWIRFYLPQSSYPDRSASIIEEVVDGKPSNNPNANKNLAEASGHQEIHGDGHHWTKVNYRKFAWSMVAVSLILVVIIIILLAFIFYQRRRQSFSAVAHINGRASSGQTLPKQTLAGHPTRRFQVSSVSLARTPRTSSTEFMY